MKTNIISGFLKRLCITACCLIGFVFLNSCDRLHEGLEPCPQGLRIRFIYDYNMEFANAFYSQVDCLTVLFYDAEGNFVTKRINTSSDLADEFWRMEIDLEPGQYHILAYGGMACENSSFSFVTDPESTAYNNIRVQLNQNCLTSPVGTELHPLFYGRLDTEVEANSTEYREVTVPMMKDTNNLRVLLQEVSGKPIDNADYDFCVTDNNTLFAWDNDLIPTPTVTYLPWARDNASPGELPDGSDASVAWAEMSFSRLVTGASPRLIITRIETGRKVVDIPLNNYLLLLKSQAFASMPPQEFLDRESRWNMIFFLNEDATWASTTIYIKDWVVRINNSEL
ncbi:MAG: FimB/Mfa2 family fimbrial subunit [Muribaculaceae bacterium]|nr:FimB/Mfa2 family fimbrial subunit [Muribaculaceae bacterium]